MKFLVQDNFKKSYELHSAIPGWEPGKEGGCTKSVSPGDIESRWRQFTAAYNAEVMLLLFPAIFLS